MSPHRFHLQYTDGTYDLRVQAHKTDPELVVVKAKHPEALDKLVILSGLDIGAKPTFKGSSYFITFCDKSKFAAACAAFVSKVSTEPVHSEPTPEEAEYDD